MFPSHYGLILTFEITKLVLGLAVFPSHYGLILTSNITKKGRDEKVSIPLWSDFNF